MGKRRSYDYDRGYPTTVDRETSAATEDLPGRVVLWRDEWPPQSEVPHAGERVWTWDGRAHTVASGIPERIDRVSRWGIALMTDSQHLTHFPLADLSRTPPTKRYKVSLDHTCCCAKWEDTVEAESEADAIAKAVRVEEVE